MVHNSMRASEERRNVVIALPEHVAKLLQCCVDLPGAALRAERRLVGRPEETKNELRIDKSC